MGWLVEEMVGKRSKMTDGFMGEWEEADVEVGGTIE